MPTQQVKPTAAGSIGAAPKALPALGSIVITPTAAGSIGAAPKVTFGLSASGSRVRSGTANVTLIVNLTASGARVRSGVAAASLVGTSGGGGSTNMPVSRWRLYDPILNQTYVFEVNPSAEGSPGRTRNLTANDSSSNTLASDGTPLIYEGAEDIATMPLKGVCLTKSAYEGMLAWFSKPYLVLLTDDLGRQMQVRLESFKPKRAPLHHHPYRHTYAATVRVFGFGTGTFNPSTAFLAT